MATLFLENGGSGPLFDNLDERAGWSRWVTTAYLPVFGLVEYYSSYSLVVPVPIPGILFAPTGGEPKERGDAPGIGIQV